MSAPEPTIEVRQEYRARNGTFTGQSQKSELKGRCWNGASLGGFPDAEGQGAPAAGDPGGHSNIVKEFSLANPRGGFSEFHKTAGRFSGAKEIHRSLRCQMHRDGLHFCNLI